MSERAYIRKWGALIVVLIMFFTSACNEDVAVSSSLVPSITETRETRVVPTETEVKEEETLPTFYTTDNNLAVHIEDSVADHFQGTIFVGIAGQRVFEASYGYADVESRQYLSENSIYETGFLTTQLTYQAFLHLIEEEDLDTNDLLSEYIPEYEYADQISLLQLIEMSSGIPDYLGNTIAHEDYVQSLLLQGLTRQESLNAIKEFADLNASFDSVLEYIQSETLLYVPGERTAFSASDYVIMAEIINRVSGVPYVHYLQRNILTPMDLETASFTMTSQTATGYLFADQMQIIVPGSRLAGEAGLRMSAADLFVWTNMLIPELLERQEEASSQAVIPLLQEMPGSVYMARSSAGGFYCLQMIIPEIELVVIIMSNQNGLEHPADDLMDSVLAYYVELYYLYEEN